MGEILLLLHDRGDGQRVTSTVGKRSYSPHVGRVEWLVAAALIGALVAAIVAAPRRAA
jgi:hypothetical protein